MRKWFTNPYVWVLGFVLGLPLTHYVNRLIIWSQGFLLPNNASDYGQTFSLIGTVVSALGLFGVVFMLYQQQAQLDHQQEQLDDQSRKELERQTFRSFEARCVQLGRAIYRLTGDGTGEPDSRLMNLVEDVIARLAATGGTSGGLFQQVLIEHEKEHPIEQRRLIRRIQQALDLLKEIQSQFPENDLAIQDCVVLLDDNIPPAVWRYLFWRGFLRDQEAKGTLCRLNAVAPDLFIPRPTTDWNRLSDDCKAAARKLYDETRVTAGG